MVLSEMHSVTKRIWLCTVMYGNFVSLMAQWAYEKRGHENGEKGGKIPERLRTEIYRILWWKLET